jgi:TetR/AcrR family transcriptional repressor of nem operon
VAHAIRSVHRGSLGAGEIDSKFEAIDLAEFLLASWEGAILRMKVERGPAALDRFKDIVFETVLKEKK